jgi:hypothetical protein
MSLAAAGLGEFWIPLKIVVLIGITLSKTITMLFKILLVERDYQLSDKIRARPRQMFVTNSRKLVGKVEELFITYFSSLAFASHMEESSYSKRTDARSSVEENIFNEDDDPTWQNNLPERFCDLEEQHFPLFIAFDHVCLSHPFPFSTLLITLNFSSALWLKPI